MTRHCRRLPNIARRGFLEIVMQGHADALPQALERAGEPRCGVSEFDRREIGRDTCPPYNHKGTVVVASAWLAFYVIAAIHEWIILTH